MKRKFVLLTLLMCILGGFNLSNLNAQTTSFYYDFNDGSLADWRLIDQDGDGYNFDVASDGVYVGYEGSVGLYSSCYNDDTELSPDNYFVTNQTYAITSTSSLSFLHHTSDALYTAEQFGVVISENGTDWIVIWSKKYDYNAPDEDWQEANVSLAEHAGKNVYLGFRHYDCSGSKANGIRIDNVKLSSEEDGGEAPATCTVIFTLKDSWGDGWNGNKLLVEYDGKQEEFTLSTGSIDYFSLEIPQDSEVKVTYSRTGQYQSENSYEIAYEDETLIHSGSGSSEVDEKTFTVDCSLKAPKAPSVFAKAASETSILLVWNEVDGATSYNVYQGGTLIEEGISKTTYTVNGLTAGQEYCYTVTAENEVGESEESEPACATPKTNPTIDLDKYYRINVYSTSNYLHITDYYASSGSTVAGAVLKQENGHQIFKIEDAGNGNYYVKTLDGYYIKCADQPNANGNNWWSIFAYSNETKTPLYFDYVDGVQFYIRDFDKVLGNGSDANKLPNSNYFKVDNGVYCDASIDNPNVVTWVLEEVPSLANVKPTNLVAELNGRSAILTWDVVEGATSYNVYLDGNKISTDMITTPTYTVAGLSAETEYCFTVTANNLISESSHSDEACVKTGAKELPEVPNLLSISVNATTIILTWEASTGATSYNVYRDGVQIQTGITELTYSDSGLTEDMRYCYSVTAVNSDGESELSDELCAKTQEMGGGDEEITIGNENSQNMSQYIPIYSYAANKYSMSQQYYTKDEINATGGNITSIAFHVAQAVPNLTHNWEIYLNNIDEITGFPSDDYFYHYQVSSSDLVFKGNVTFPENGWVEINLDLDEPLTYEGNHILVTVVDNSLSGNRNIAFTASLSSVINNVYYVTRGNSSNIMDPTKSTGTYTMGVDYGRRNDIRFTFSAPASTIEFINDGDWNTASNWNTGVVPSATDDVIIKANATINDNIEVKHLSVEGGSLTIESGSLTVTDIMVNNYAEDLIIKDSAQVFQTNDNVLATFRMNIAAPTAWEEWNETGWQFISSPMKDATTAGFAPTTQGSDYDLFKYDGNVATPEDLEWVNYKGHKDFDFEAKFQQGQGYMASYKVAAIAEFVGVLNNATSFDFSNKMNTSNANDYFANFYLLGNPFSFDMKWNNNNIAASGLAEGYAVVTTDGSYNYATTGDIKVGDGFFVKVTGTNPSLSYTANTRNRNVDENKYINLIASNKAGSDNVIINFADNGRDGFAKLENFNKDIAEIYVKENENRYGILNYSEDVEEIEVYFNAKKMGYYTINAISNADFSNVTLIDRITGIETNILTDSYTFQATAKDSPERFIIRIDKETESENFVYKSGEELIINAKGCVQIIDVMGRIVYSNDIVNDNHRINISSFKNATYIVRVVNTNEVKTQKIVIW